MVDGPESDLCVVVPVKHEVESLSILAGEVGDALSPHPWQWECLFIDDGSIDDTLERLKSLHEKEPRIRLVSLDRNHGQAAAMLEMHPMQPGDVVETYSDIGPLKEDTDFIPTISLDVSVARFVAWYKGYHDHEGEYESFESPVAFSSHGGG